MNGRCQAVSDNGKQCRRTKHLSRTLVSLVRQGVFSQKLPPGAIIMLCPQHLRLSPMERIVMSSRKFANAVEERGA